MVEAVLGLTVLLRRFRLTAQLREPPLDIGIVLRPGGPLPAHVPHRRPWPVHGTRVGRVRV